MIVSALKYFFYSDIWSNIKLSTSNAPHVRLLRSVVELDVVVCSSPLCVLILCPLIVLEVWISEKLSLGKSNSQAPAWWLSSRCFVSPSWPVVPRSTMSHLICLCACPVVSRPGCIDGSGQEDLQYTFFSSWNTVPCYLSLILMS